MFRSLASLTLAALLWAGPALAQHWTLTALHDIPFDPTRPQLVLQLRGLAAQHLLGVASTDNGFSYRVEVATHTLQKIECPTIPRSATSGRGGPDMFGLNTVIAWGYHVNDQGLIGVI